MLHGAANPSKSAIASLSEISRERELKSIFQRQKLVTRIITELWLVGVFRDASDATAYGLPAFAKVKSASGTTDPPPLMALKEILSSDLVNFEPVTVIFMLHKYYGQEILGNAEGLSQDSITPIVSAQTRIRFRRVLGTYAASFDRRVRFVSRQLLIMQRLNEKRVLKFGALREEYETTYNNLMEEAVIMLSNCQHLFELLDLPMATVILRRDSDLDGSVDTMALEGELWNDDSEKNFYEDTVRLAPAEDIADDVSDVSDDEEEEKLLQNLEKLSDKPEPAEEQPDDDKEYAPKARSKSLFPKESEKASADTSKEVEEILETLARNPDKDIADECSYQFKEVNDAKSRAAVLQFFINIRPGDQYKLRYYCRFIANINPIAPGVLDGILEYLLDFFGYARTRKSPKLYSTRMFIIRYYSELVKFGLVPKTATFHIFHSLLTWVDKQSTEMVCSFLEGCGKYLYYKPATHKIMGKYIDFIEKTRSSNKLGIDERLLISYAIHYVKPPPPLSAIPAKERSTIERYIRKLIYLDLDADNKDVILAKLYKMDWSDQETFHVLRKVFCKVWKVKQENITLISDMLQDIKKYHYSFTVMVSDSILEDIRRGLELGGFKNNQMRLSQAIFLGELCKRRIVDHTVIMSTLYLMLTLGYAGNMPTPEGCALDMPTELFRVRLACTLLDSCGQYLNFVDEHLPARGIAREIDLYMSFLQYYTRLKRNVSMDIEFQLRDTFKRVRPGFPLYETIDGATRGMEAVMAGRAPPAEESSSVQVMRQTGHTSAEEEAEDVARHAEFSMPKWEKSEEEERQRQRQYEDKKKRQEERENLQAEDDLETELQNLMLDRTDITASGVRTGINVKRPFDAPVPNSAVLKLDSGKPGSTVEPPKKGHVKYALLLKSNGGTSGSSSYGKNLSHSSTTIRTMELPSTSKFVSSQTKEREEREKEKERIKNIIMKYEYLNDENEGNGEPRRIVQPVIKSTRFRQQPAVEAKEYN